MRTSLQNLARYYADVLTALAENSGRVLRDLPLGRRYGLVADLSVLNPSTHELLTSPIIRLGKAISDLATNDDQFATEPEGYDSETEIQEGEFSPEPKQTEGNALVRIWRKQKQDTYNRETLMAAAWSAFPKTKALWPVDLLSCQAGVQPMDSNWSSGAVGA